MPTCRNCTMPFEVSTGDMAFYEKIEVPQPTLCSQCRLLRRLSFRNERTLYKRSCDMCKKHMVAMFDADAPFTVYCHTCWWSDAWDPRSYGRDFDFTRPFFEQFNELMHDVPKAGTFQLSNENSDYNSLLAYSKNSYMSPGSYYIENCFYVRKSQYSRDCLWSNALNKCELVGESTNCDNCYSAHHLMNCRNCSFSSYLNDCVSVENSFMCSGLRNKKYCFKNKQYSAEEYERIITEYATKTSDELYTEFTNFILSVPQRAVIQMNCENSSGDYLQNCKNAEECYDCFEVQDSKYLIECVNVKDSMDLSFHDKEIELCYELCSGGERNYLTKFSFVTCDSPQSEYLYSCFFLTNCFGCDGFHSRNQYMIFNKQYTAEEYTVLRKQIIEHMKKTGEYGEFFPSSISPYAYNESIAQDYFPLTQEMATTYSMPWKGESTTSQEKPNDAATCTTCAKFYKIIPHERELHVKIGFAPSTRCAECRYKHLIALKNPKHLWQRQCGRCGAALQTTYHPTRPEIVYCDACYMAHILKFS